MQSRRMHRQQPLASRARSQRSFYLALFAGLIGTISIASAPIAKALPPAPAVLKAKAPELPERSADEWFNSKPLKLSELRGQVVVLHFWAFACPNCKRNDAAYRAWHQKYSTKGVTMIGVHTPEFEREHDLKRLKKSIEDRSLKYPIVVDQDRKTWKSWGNRWWPSIYLIDKNGFIRYRWDGELGWRGAKGQAIMEKKIDELLVEENPATANN
jgi:peroxiredoxin